MNIQNIVSIVGLVGSVAGGAYFVEDRYIDTKEHSVLETNVLDIQYKLEAKILSDELYLVKDRAWKIRDRLDKDPENRELERALTDLEERAKNLQKEIDLLKLR